MPGLRRSSVAVESVLAHERGKAIVGLSLRSPLQHRLELPGKCVGSGRATGPGDRSQPSTVINCDVDSVPCQEQVRPKPDTTYYGMVKTAIVARHRMPGGHHEEEVGM